MSMHDLDYFVGAWQLTAEDPTSGRRFTMSYQVEPVLGGAWLIGSGRAPELGLEIHDVWGADATSGELIRSIYQSDHNHGTVRSKGWDGDRLLLEGLVRTPPGEVPVRETITRLGPDGFRAVWEMQGEAGWVAYSVELAVRSAAAMPSPPPPPAAGGPSTSTRARLADQSPGR